MYGLSRTPSCIKSRGFSLEPLGLISWIADLDHKYRQTQKLHSLTAHQLLDMGLKVQGGSIRQSCSKS